MEMTGSATSLLVATRASPLSGDSDTRISGLTIGLCPICSLIGLVRVVASSRSEAESLNSKYNAETHPKFPKFPALRNDLVACTTFQIGCGCPCRAGGGGRPCRVVTGFVAACFNTSLGIGGADCWFIKPHDQLQLRHACGVIPHVIQRGRNKKSTFHNLFPGGRLCGVTGGKLAKYKK